MLRSTRARRLLDGINSIKYTRLKLEFRPLYTWIYVTVNETETMNNKAVKAKIAAVQAALAKIARDKAKTEQAKKELNSKLTESQRPAQTSSAQNGKPALTSSAQSQKPAQTSSAQNGKPNPTPPAGKEALAQARRAQLQGALIARRVQALDAMKAQSRENIHPKPAEIQNHAPLQPKLPPIKIPTVQSKPVPKPVPKAVPKPVPGPFGAKPKFVSWVPTNASVPERLTIAENLGKGPVHMKQPKRLLNAKEVT